MKLKISRSEWVSFILTLIATLIGVLLAISLTNRGIKNKEKEDTIKLLQTAKLILSNTQEMAVGLGRTIVELEKDTLNYDLQTMDDIKSINPIPYPDLLEPIVSNELFAKNVSEYCHANMYTGLINLKKLASYETISYYQFTIEQLIFLLELEIDYQKGALNAKEIEKKMTNYEEELSEQEIDNEILKISIDSLGNR